MELIISLLIAAIVLSMILMFLNSASKGFRRTNDDVNLQMEAQTIINHLSNLAMEAVDMTTLVLPNEERFIFEYSMDKYYTIIVYEGCLYQIFTADIDQAKTASYTKELDLLAEYVDSLAIDKEANRITIDLSLSLGKDSARLSKKVKLRNAS